MSFKSFVRDVRRSRFFRHGVVLGLLVGVPMGWIVKPAPRTPPATVVRAAISLPIQVSRGFPSGEEVLFTVRVKNSTPRIFSNIEASCVFVDSTGSILGSGSQAWAAVGPNQSVSGVIRAPSLLGTVKAECEARGQ